MSSLIDKVGKNFGLLLGGQVAAAIFGLLALYLMMRCLSPAELGIIVLIQAYVASIREILNFKLFEPIVRYGVPKLDAGDHSALRRLFCYTLQIDVALSFSAAVVAIAAASIVGPVIGLDPAYNSLIVGFSLVLLASANNTSKGALRLYGRFDLLSSVVVVGSGARLAGALIAFLLNADVVGFAIAWVLSLLVQYVYINYCGWKEVHRQIQRPLHVEPGLVPFRKQFPGWWSFVNVVYWQGNLDLLPKHVSTLFAGVFLGPSGAGLFRIARELSGVFTKPAVQLRHVVFPNLTRLWYEQNRAFTTLCLRLGLWVGLPALAIVAMVHLFGTQVVELFLGAEYTLLVPLLVLMLLAAALELMTATLRPAGYAAGQANMMLRIQIVSTFVYLLLFLICTESLGLIGPGIAALVATGINVCGMIAVLSGTTRHLDA